MPGYAPVRSLRLLTLPMLAIALLPTACSPLQSAFMEAPEAPADAFAPVRFLVGTWRDDREALVRVEAWTEPAGGAMYGVSRTERGGELREFELLAITARSGTLVYEARPSGGPAVPFALADHGPDRVTFANPAHDFPRRIHYWRDGERLRAAIDDGTDTHRIEFAWHLADG